MKKLLMLVLTGLLSVALAVAQQVVTGTVTDSESGGPLEGASVIVKGTTLGVLTGSDGKYKLSMPKNSSVLIVSYVGKKTVEQAVVGSSLDVTMVNDAMQVDEVVVTALGISREKKALSYSVQEIDGSKITRATTPNLSNAMQGKIAGMQVNQSGGMPGASTFIRIRGSRSLSGNNQPLFVIDGMTIESSSAGSESQLSANGGTSGTDYSSRSLDINPNDIESVTVLKGPAAAALYGIRAANGVVIITTKSGRNSKKRTNISFSQNITVDQVSRTPDLQSTYAQGSGGNFNQTGSTSWGPKIANMQPYTNNVGLSVTPTVYDNVTPLFQNGVTSVSNLDITGKNEQGNYAFGLGYTGQTGIIPTTGMNRINVKLGGDYNISSKLTTGATVNFIKTDIDKLAGGSNLSNVLFTTYWAPRSYDLWGTPFNASDDPYTQIHYRGAMDNPRWSLENNRFNENITRSFGSAHASYKPTNWLSVNYRIGADVYTERRKEIYGLGSGGTGGRGSIAIVSPGVTRTVNAPSGGQITDGTNTYQQINSNLNLAFSKKLTDDIQLDALVGNEIVDITTQSLSVVGTGIQIGGFENLSNTANQNSSQSSTAQRIIGNFASLNPSYKSMLFLTMTIRQDRVSNMPSASRNFTYPSVGLGFVFTEIEALKDNKFLGYGKIRASYAEAGQAGGVFVQAVPYIPMNADNPVGTGFTSDGIVFPFNGLQGFRQSNVAVSKDLVPENTATWEFGTQLKFFSGKIGVDVNYFTAHTTDQIFAVPVSSTTGYSSEVRNAGEVVSRGWEISLDATPLALENGLQWDFVANYTRVYNEVVSLAPGVENIFLGGFTEPNVRAQAGSQYPILFGSKYLRDDAGNIVYESRQFIDGKVNPDYGQPITDPVAGPIGNVSPQFEIGFNNTVSFKGFQLGFHFDIRKGGYMYSGNTRLQKFYGMDAVTEDRETAVVPEGVKGYLDGDGKVVVEGPNDIAIRKDQTYWATYMDNIDESNVYETSFIRFRELNLSYMIPASLLASTPIKGLTVSFSARNLALWTSYPNFDPETSLGGATGFQGFEYVNLPQTRSLGGGLSLSF